MLRFTSKRILPFLLCVIFQNVHAAQLGKPQNLLNHKDWNFVQNRGQLIDENGQPQTDISYYGHQGGVYLYCRPGRLSFVFTKVEEDKSQKCISEATGAPVETGHVETGHALSLRAQIPTKITTCRADLILLNANPSATISAEDQQAYYENFYTAYTGEQGITNVHTYKTIVYHNVYPHIDMVLHAKPQGMKYEFVVNPGGKVSDIQMQWDGVEKMAITDNGGIKYSLPFGEMEEGKPYSYQNNTEIVTKFVQEDNAFKFGCNRYNHSKPLIIDPFISWSEYYPIIGLNANSVKADINSNYVYLTGETGVSNINLATSGVYQTKSGGDVDAYITKFDQNGKIIWCTYFGGTGTEYASCISTDKNNDLILAGKTNSTKNIATSGSYQSTFAGGANDAYLAKFHSNGTLAWATFFGGAGDDGFNSITVDSANNIYAAGRSASSSGIATSGSYQTSFGGYYDGIVSKFSTKGSLIWSTYVGGSDLDEFFDIKMDSSYNIVLVGRTASSSGIATSGAYQTSNGGAEDMMLIKMKNAGSVIWSTYFGGSNHDIGTRLAIDTFGSLYVTGYTNSTSGIASSGAYKTKSSGDFDMFLTKFTKNGLLQWSTYFGGESDDEGWGMVMTKNGKVIIGGLTNSTLGIADNNSQKKYNSGGYDAFLASFSSSGGKEWSTYYGGSADDNGFSLSIDTNNNLYFAGKTFSDFGIATMGKWIYQSQKGFLAKFNLSRSNYDAGINAILSPKNSFCKGKNDVKINLVNFGNFQLDSLRIGFSINGEKKAGYNWTGTLPSDSAETVNIGTCLFTKTTDTIKVWSSYSKDSTPQNDTFSVIVNLLPIADASPGSDSKICFGDSISIGQSQLSGVNYSWSSVPKGFIAATGTVYVKPLNTTRYYLTTTLLSDGCKNTDSILIDINALPVVNAGPDISICTGDSIKLGVHVQKHVGYSWYYNSVNTSFSQDSAAYVHPVKKSVYYLKGIDSLTGCSNTDTVNVSVNSLPKANCGAASSICYGDSINIGAASDLGCSYQWKSSPAGYTSTLSNPAIAPEISTIYTLTEINDSTGCKKTDSVKITVNSLPSVFMGYGTSICKNDSIIIGDSLSAGISYKWYSKPNGISNSKNKITISPLSKTTYYLTETITKTGCKKTDSLIVTVKPLPIVNKGIDSQVCLGKSAILGKSPVSGDTYSWSSNPKGFTSTLSNPTVTPASTTWYILKETDTTTGCSNTDSVKVAVNSLPPANTGADRSICPGGSTTLGGTAIPGLTYSWVSAPSGFTSTLNSPTVNPTATTLYILTEGSTTTGCTSTDTVKVTVDPLPKPAFSAMDVCPSDSVPFTNHTDTATAYQWSFGDGKTSASFSPKHIYASNGTYTITLKATNKYGCSDSISKTITISPCVWPGDANNDKTVDMSDFINIGVAFGTVGHPRASASLSWTGQPAKDWDSTFSGGVNYKHADCDGDSVIGYSDTLAISLNYGLSHSKSSPLDQGATSDPGFRLRFAKDTFYAGDTIAAILSLGASGNPVKNLYGLRFSIQGNSSLFDLKNTSVKLLPGSFMGTPGTQVISMCKYNAGLVDIGMVRITHTNAAGASDIAILSIPVKSTFTSEYNHTALTISNNAQLSYNGKSVPLYFTSDSVLLKQDKTGIISQLSTANNINIYPNPFSTSTTLQYSLLKPSKVHIELLDVTGKVIGVVRDGMQAAGMYRTDIVPAAWALNPGVYTLKFVVNDETLVRQVVKY